MTALTRDLEGAVLRANPGYRLVTFAELEEQGQPALASLRRDPTQVAVLEPIHDRELAVKSICRETAKLFRTLQTPRPVPTGLRHRVGPALDRELAELVLDGVLEIESAGAFVSGPSARGLVLGGVRGEGAGRGATGRLARLSMEAIRYAADLDLDGAVKLSARMYFFHRLPVTARWKDRWPDEDAVLRDLGLAPGGACRNALGRDYVASPGSDPMRGWAAWNHRRRDAQDRRRVLPYKLYVSPLPADLPAAAEALAATLAEVPCPSFKLGRNCYGLLRPDKVVCYFSSHGELERFGRRLRPRLEGCAAHGVPFSAALTDDGLLSWGMDPPPDPGRPGWMETESWRLWITNHLARALLAARREPGLSVEPARFALERLRLAGVDTETWMPEASARPRTTPRRRN